VYEAYGMHRIEEKYIHNYNILVGKHGKSEDCFEDSVDKKTRIDVTFCILYFSSNSCSICFGQPCAHHQELTTA